ncbi:MAG: deoxyguanosinetriphosphate triphosphohydrolase [Nevskiales bacterium]
MNLAAYAAHESRSRGRRHLEPGAGFRSQYQRDRDRIVHSAAFRRLEYKTQVFVNHEGDLFRTRLTHSIEVAQIGRTLARALNLHEDLTEAIALAHDLGHTPFGHAGQDALDECMKAYGGFEHNLQSLRVVDELEEKYADFDGLNLTFETREGILKHCTKAKAKELGELGRRFLDGGQPSLEAQLANLADEIAYNNHDIDDGLRARLLTLEQLQESSLFLACHEEVRQQHPQLMAKRVRHEVVRRMINRLVTDLLEHSRAMLTAVAPADIAAVRASPEPLAGFSPAMQKANTELKRLLHRHLYQHYHVQRMTQKAKRVVRDLFGAFIEAPNLLPVEFQQHAQKLRAALGEHGTARSIADYIAGMTDRYAIDEHDRIFNPRRTH